MKTLYDCMNESLLDDEDDIVNNEDTIVEKSILDWIKKYCAVNRKDKIEIVKDNDKYIVNADWLSISASAPQIPTDLFTFGTVTNFEMFMNLRWTNMVGCPKVVKKECYITGCDKLVSLEGCPEETGNFICTSNKNLKSLIGAPKKIKGNVNVSDCSSIKNLEGIGNMKKNKTLYCSKCNSLESFKGAPKEVKGFQFSDDMKLKSLDYMPMVSEFVAAHDVPFSKEDILKLLNIDINKKTGKLIAITTRDGKDGMNTTEFYYI